MICRASDATTQQLRTAALRGAAQPSVLRPPSLRGFQRAIHGPSFEPSRGASAVYETSFAAAIGRKQDQSSGLRCQHRREKSCPLAGVQQKVQAATVLATRHDVHLSAPLIVSDQTLERPNMCKADVAKAADVDVEYATCGGAVAPNDAAGLLSTLTYDCLLYTSPSPRDGLLSRMPSSA